MATPLVPASVTSFLFRMGAGFAGTISRAAGAATVEPALIDSTNPPLYFGSAVVQDATAFAIRPPTTGDTVIAGFTVRAFPTQGNFPATPQVDPVGSANVPASGLTNLLKRGYISVPLSGTGTPERYGTVYVWIGATGSGHVNGGVEIAATSGSTITLDAKSYFMGPADSNGNVEIAFNI